MVKLEVISDRHQHAVVLSDEPCRMEFSVHNGKLLVHVYKGVEIDYDQEPVGCFDGHEGNNKDWSVQ